MAFFRRMEDKSSQILEGFFRRTFPRPLKPVEIAKHLLKEMLRRKTVSISTVYVPNVYVTYLPEKEWLELTPLGKSFPAELARYLEQEAASRGYTMVGPAQVFLEPQEGLAPGEVFICARYEEGPTSPEELPPDIRGKWQLVIIQGNRQGLVIPLTKKRLLLGRNPDVGIDLEDPGISRQHCSIEYINGRWFISDLGSKNGTFVNGEKITRRALTEGDKIELGLTTLVVEVV